MTDLFKNTHEALIFAFNYSSQQYALSPMAKMMKTGMVGKEKGLVSLDGAAQAGIIKAEIDRLPSQYRSCIIARYALKYHECSCCGGPKMRSEYLEAVANLAETSLSWFSGLSVRNMRRGIIQSFYEKSVKIAELADELGVSRRTAYDQRSKIIKRLQEIDADAQAMVCDGLITMFDVAEPHLTFWAKPKKAQRQVSEAPIEPENLVPCAKCNGEPVKSAIAFFNTGHDSSDRKCAEVTVECKLCNGSGKVIPAIAARYLKGQEHRNARIARRETLYVASQRLEVSPVDLSSYENGYKDLPKVEKASATHVNAKKA